MVMPINTTTPSLQQMLAAIMGPQAGNTPMNPAIDPTGMAAPQIGGVPPMPAPAPPVGNTAPAAPMPMADTGAPLVPQEVLRQKMAAALSGNVPVSEDSKRNALIHLGTALMQPMQPGQSGAGHLGAAVGGYVDTMAAEKDKALAAARSDATFAMQANASDMQTRKMQLELSELAQKAQYIGPQARAELYKTAASAVQAIAQGDNASAEAMLTKAKAEHASELAAAEVKLRKAQAAEAYARAGAEGQRASLYKMQAVNEKQGKTTGMRLSDGSFAVIEFDPQGRPLKASIVSQRDQESIDADLQQQIKAGNIKKDDQAAKDKFRYEQGQLRGQSVDLTKPMGGQQTPAATTTGPTAVITKEQLRQQLGGPTSSTEVPTATTGAQARDFNYVKDEYDKVKAELLSVTDLYKSGMTPEVKKKAQLADIQRLTKRMQELQQEAAVSGSKLQ